MGQALGARHSLRVRDDGYCFACGSENPIGRKLDFKLVDGRTEATFVPAWEHQGFVSIIHGGFIAFVLDEAMAKLLSLPGVEALTCELTVRLNRVTRVGEQLRVTARCIAEHKRLLELEAQAADVCGEAVASARAKLLRVGGGAADAALGEGSRGLGQEATGADT